MRAPLDAPVQDPLSEGYDLLVLDEQASGPSRLWTIDAASAMKGSEIHLPPAELRDLSDLLLQTWQSEIGFPGDPPPPLQLMLTQRESDWDAVRARLAATGNYVFRTLRDALDDEMATAFTGIVERHLQKPADSARPLVFISSGLLPLRLLYACPGDIERVVDEEEDDPTTVDAGGFLGMAGVVDDQLTAGGTARANKGTTVPVGVYKDLEVRPGGEQDLRKVLEHRPDLEPRYQYDERDLFKAIRRDTPALIYIYCHGKFQDGASGQRIQQLLLRRAFSSLDVRRRIGVSPGLSTHPIAFVNACQGGVFRADRASTVLSALRQLGASGTIAPLVDIPISFGGPFGVAVIEQLVNNCSLSAALLRATRSFVKTHRNPLGLVYVTASGRQAWLPPSRTTVTERRFDIGR